MTNLHKILSLDALQLNFALEVSGKGGKTTFCFLSRRLEENNISCSFSQKHRIF